MTTKKLTILALSTAMQVALLLISLILPTVKMSMLFAASVLNGLLCSAGYKKRHVFMSFAATGVLSFILIPHYIIPAAYALLFGAYGIVHFATHAQKLVIKQLIRFAYIGAGAALLYVIFKGLFAGALFLQTPYIYFLPVGLAAGYILFQLLYDAIIREFYKNKYLKNLLLEK